MPLTRHENARLKFCRRWESKLAAAVEKAREKADLATKEWDAAQASYEANADELKALEAKANGQP